MNGFGTFIDNSDILQARALTRDEAMKIRDHMRGILRTFELAHSLPFSFHKKSEQGDLRNIGLHNATPKDGHHNL